MNENYLDKLVLALLAGQGLLSVVQEWEPSFCMPKKNTVIIIGLHCITGYKD